MDGKSVVTRQEESLYRNRARTPPRNFLPANLINLPSHKNPGIFVFTNNQQICHPYS